MLVRQRIITAPCLAQTTGADLKWSFLLMPGQSLASSSFKCNTSTCPKKQLEVSGRWLSALTPFRSTPIKVLGIGIGSIEFISQYGLFMVKASPAFQ
jgi:hypothetical protein